MVARIAVIAGTGFYGFPEMIEQEVIRIDSPFGPPVEMVTGLLNGRKTFFLPRHGKQHHVPPHKINYRANIQALAEVGVEKIIAVNAVGGITEDMAPGKLVVPHQVIDYTHGRAHTFFDSFDNIPDPVGSCHIDFSEPFSVTVRNALLKSLESHEEDFSSEGVYGCTGGPRLETIAEIRRLKNDGCDIVGMTLMPEAALAREKKLEYASLCLVVNWAAGVEKNQSISIDEMKRVLQLSMERVRVLIFASITRL